MKRLCTLYAWLILVSLVLTIVGFLFSFGYLAGIALLSLIVLGLLGLLFRIEPPANPCRPTSTSHTRSFFFTFTNKSK